MNMVELAQRLKRIRMERGLTLEDVASRAGLTRGWLSKVENFRVTPSLPALADIASVLDTPLSELFEGLDQRPSFVVVRKDQRLVMQRDEDLESRQEYESLAHSRPARSMDPFIITVPPVDNRPPLAHPGEEFLMVLSGKVDFEYGDRKETLEEGDSAYFDGEEKHKLICLSEKPATVLVVFYETDSTNSLSPSEKQ